MEVPSEVNLEQKLNLFYIRIIMQGGTCLTTIDGGSCVNVISIDFVPKLGLKVQPHLEPYALHWLNCRGVTHVHKHVLIPIVISDYANTVLCDVVSMGATHLLLKKP